MAWSPLALFVSLVASPAPAVALGGVGAELAIEQLAIGGHFHDGAELVPASVAQELETTLTRLERRAGHRVHVLILPRMEGGFRSLAGTVQAADERWQIGRNRDRAGVLLLYLQDSDILHVDTLRGREIPAVESGIGGLLDTVARFQKVGDTEGAFRVAVEGLANLVEGRAPPPPPVPRPHVPTASAGSQSDETVDVSGAAPATGYVVDEAAILSAEAIASLNGLLHDHERQTSNQVLVLTIPSLNGESLEAVSLRRATELRIGQKDRDNGVLLLVVRDERKLRIEVGYGLEAALPDAVCARIIREVIVPRFREGDYDGGILGGVQRILATVRGEYRPTVADRARDLFGWLPALPELPLTPQFILGIFFWFFAIVACFAGPELLSIAGKPVRLGLLPTLPVGAYLLVNYPGFLLAPVALGVIGLLGKYGGKLGLAGTSGSGGSSSSHSSSSGRSSWSSSSSSSSSSSGSSFSGGGGSFGGGGASGGW